MSLALRNLLHDRTRLILSVVAIGLAIALILILNGFLAGVSRQSAAYLDHAPGTLVVAPAGTENFLGSSALLPGGIADAVKATPGVKAAVPVLTQVAILDMHGRKEAAYLIGYDPALGGGPWRIAKGREPATDAEAVIDRVMANRHGLNVGDAVEMQGRAFRVSGLADGVSTWATTMVFVRASALESLILTPGATSFLFVSLEPGVDPDGLRDQLAAVAGIEVLPKRDLIANDVRLLATLFRPPLRLMVAIAFLVGTLVVGLVTYTATLERRREYGVLKAIGVRNARLFGLVTAQALIASVAGSTAGVVLAVAGARLIGVVRPQLLVSIAPGAVGVALATGVTMALLAALIPARVVARLAPADVFRR